MRAGPSLRFRLLAGTTLWTAVALASAWLLLSSLFARHVEQQALRRLEGHLDELIAALDLSPSALPRLESSLSDPGFRRPLSGLYWQVEGSDLDTLRSRSLWDEALALPEPDAGAGVRQLRLSGPDRAELVAVERTLLLKEPGRWLRLAVAMDRAHVTEVTGPFGRLLAAALGVLAAGLLAAAALQVSAGLRPFRPLRAALAAVREGRRSRVEGRHPPELQPLVDEVNALLGHQEAVIERARTQAGNLAHGLKTPLALVANEADELERQGMTAPGERLRAAVGSMGRLVDVHLARARMAAAPNVLGMRTPVAPVAERVVRTLRRLHAERPLEVELDVAPELAFAGDAEDLSELLGNLVDNGCKWGRTRVEVAARREGRRLHLEVADDGPGLDAAHSARALSRGQRLDEAVPGDGLGLSIVRELAALYGGAVRLERAPLGGLRAVVELPAC